LVDLLLLNNHHDEVVHYLPYFSKNMMLAFGALVSLLALSALAYYAIEVPARSFIKAYSQRQDPSLSVATIACQESGNSGAPR